MMLDLAIRGGTVATASDIIRCDVGSKDDRIVLLAEAIKGADQAIDATGHFVLRVASTATSISISRAVRAS